MKVTFPTRLPSQSDPRYQGELFDLLRNIVTAINDNDIRSGPSTDRPTGPDLRLGRLYDDTTIGQLIRYDGAVWTAVNGTAL